MAIIILSVVVLVAVVVCAALYMQLKSQRESVSALNGEIAALKASEASLSTSRDMLVSQLENERHRAESLDARLSDATSALGAERETSARLKESLHQTELQREERERALEERFKNLANEILIRNSREFKEQNEQRLGEILNPLRQNIDEFRKTVTDTYNAEARERFSLSERIHELVELNNTIGREAKELTGALKGNNKMQGDWGEMVLETILEKSGLRSGIEYKTQESRTTEESKGRPDVVVYYPDDRCVIIDSKVSLKAFMDYLNADTPEQQKTAGDGHLRSVRAHVDELHRKNYQELIGASALDFVMMFIPNEPAYIAAMRLDPGLWQYAYEKRVLIVCPTHLVSALRLIEQLWSRDRQSRNAIEIAKSAGDMYDKFAAFVADMEKIDKALNTTRNAYDEAMKKLSSGRGNLLNRAESLRKMGVKASKSIARAAAEEDNTDAAGE